MHSDVVVGIHCDLVQGNGRDLVHRKTPRIGARFAVKFSEDQHFNWLKFMVFTVDRIT